MLLKVSESLIFISENSNSSHSFWLGILTENTIFKSFEILNPFALTLHCDLFLLIVLPYLTFIIKDFAIKALELHFI